MLVIIDSDERFPVYSFAVIKERRPGKRAVEVDAKTLRRWKAAEKAWERIQAELAELDQ